ncbi:hypothetical protein [Streptomyces anulatus]|uniref:hypothetical protein n=1 Tax=Streptomyces anulatus TaxID=1892 RepID=UPI0033EBEBB3
MILWTSGRGQRPLGDVTVQAPQVLRELDTFFPGDFAARIDRAFAAPQATCPSADRDVCNTARWGVQQGTAQ